ncbi:hypothetical protein LCGC14_0231990 [marine sediment metagenome]|uniref:Uncharacterized protein n=1 Tax=marine sediment metagenome TaxID=412755 RepID=A0A0F9WUQ1_9ZZZZ
MSAPGYLTTIKKSGTATSMTSEAMSTNSTVSNTFQLDAAAKRILNRDGTFVVREAGTTAPVSAASVVIDYLFGKVTLSSATTSAITLSGSYMPMTEIAGANSFTLEQIRDSLDDTDFTSVGWRSRIVGIKDVSLTLGRWQTLGDDFFSLIDSGESVVAEIQPGGAGDVGRGWFKIETEGFSGDIGSLESADVTLQVDASTLTDFSWGSA